MSYSELFEKLRNDIRRATKSDLISHVNEFRKRQKYARIPAVYLEQTTPEKSILSLAKTFKLEFWKMLDIKQKKFNFVQSLKVLRILKRVAFYYRGYAMLVSIVISK